jgi:hypothetical protein
VVDGEKLLTYLNSALKVLSGLDIVPRGTKKKLNFVDQCYRILREIVAVQQLDCGSVLILGVFILLWLLLVDIGNQLGQ